VKRNNTTEALDLYSSIEDIIGVKDVAPSLYAHYLLLLSSIEFDSLLDVGCGSGDFLSSISSAFEGTYMMGIDLSPKMVEQTLQRDINAKCIDLCLVDNQYDVITATFDMINYLNDSELKRFLDCIWDRLNDGGYFLCDINTLHGFKDVAVGSFISDMDDRFLAIDSDFEDDIYSATFTLFTKSNELYHKSSEDIYQYYHTTDKISNISKLKLIESDMVTLYSDEADKEFLVFKKMTI